jgi:hypothetical protein
MDYGLSMIPFYNIFTPLARADFDRAVLLAQSIGLKEASVFAQFAICRTVLAKPRAPESPHSYKPTSPMTTQVYFCVVIPSVRAAPEPSGVARTSEHLA